MIHWSNFIYNPLYEFHTAGGAILVALIIAALIMWSLIVERYLYFTFNRKQSQIRYLQLWRTTRSETIAQRQLLKLYYLSEYRIQSERGIAWIHQLVKVSLLLGLLGTILVLIAVFESQLLIVSASNQPISNGIAQAIIPTTTGLLVSLSGLFFVYHLRNLANNSVSRLDDLLR